MTSRGRRIGSGIAIGLAVIVAAAAEVYFFQPQWIVDHLIGAERRHQNFARKEALVAGHRMPYLEGGQGAPMVLIHGFGDTKDSWLGFAGPLTKRYRVLVPDLPGYGEAPMPADGDLSIGAQAGRVHAFMAAVGAPRAHVGGISMGGAIAGIVAARHPDAVLTLALFNSAGGADADTLMPLVREIDEGGRPFDITDRAGFVRLVSQMAFKRDTPPDLIQRYAVRMFRAHREEWNRAFDRMRAPPDRSVLDSLAPGITATTFVLWGADDQLFHPSVAGKLAGRLPRAVLRIVPECGHVCIFERANETGAEYIMFLERAARIAGIRDSIARAARPR